MIQNLGELLSDKSITEVEFVLNGLIKIGRAHV